MKKILALFLILSLSFSSLISTSVSAEEDKMTSEAYSFVNYFDIFDTEKNISDEISRAEFSTYIARVLGINEYAKNEITYYNDVPADHWAAVCINNLADIGAYTIDEGKNFRPDDKVTVAEAVKTLLNILGYKRQAELNGGFPNGYIALARQLNLLDNVKQTGTLINSDAGDLLLNFINVDVFEAIIEDGEMKWTTVEDKGVLNIYRDIYLTEGTVTAVNQTALYEGDELDGTILIDGVRYNYSGDARYLGHYVKAYYKQSGTDIPEICFLISETKEENILEINAYNLESFDEDYVLKYYRTENSAKATSVRIPRNASFIYNGIAISKNIIDSVNIDQGSITLLKTKGSSDYNVVIIREYETFVVSFADANKQIIVDAGNPENIKDLSEDNIKAKIFDVNGNEVNFAAISKNYALTIYETPGEYMEVYVSQNKLTGYYNNTVVDGEDKYLIINNQRYRVSEKYYDSIQQSITRGREIKFILDMFGEVAFVESVSSDSEFVFAWYLNHEVVVDAEEYLFVRAYTEADGVKRYMAAEKVKIDGNSAKKPGPIGEKLTESIQKTNEIFDKMQQKTSKITSRLIRIKLNDEGMISEIDTPYTGPNETKTDALFISDCIPELTGMGGRGSKSIYVDGTNTIIGFKTVYNKDTTTTFLVPTDSSLKNATSEMFSTGDGYKNNADSIVYKTSREHGIADVIVTVGDVTTDLMSYNAIMISNITTGLDADENQVEYIEGYLGQSPVQYTMASDARSWEGDSISMSEYGVEIGDIVTLIFNASGEIETFFLSYDCSEDKCYNAPAYAAKTDASGTIIVPARKGKNLFTNLVAESFLDFYDCFYNYGTFTKGIANEFNNNMLGISFEEGEESSVLYPVSSKKAMVYDSDLKKNGFYTGTMADIVTYEDAGAECSTIVAVHHAADWNWYYIYK